MTEKIQPYTNEFIFLFLSVSSFCKLFYQKISLFHVYLPTKFVHDKGASLNIGSNCTS